MCLFHNLCFKGRLFFLSEVLQTLLECFFSLSKNIKGPLSKVKVVQRALIFVVAGIEMAPSGVFHLRKENSTLFLKSRSRLGVYIFVQLCDVTVDLHKCIDL